MSKFEPLPREKLPKDLHEFPDLIANELYLYRAVRRAPARIFNDTYENSLGKKRKTKTVAFHLPHVAIFFARAAAEGVIGNLAYAALCKLIERIRHSKSELFPTKLRFETVVSRVTYNSVRRDRHPDSNPSKAITERIESKIETQYRLIVLLKREPSIRRRNKPKRKAD
jgi:hypothetical protein